MPRKRELVFVVLGVALLAPGLLFAQSWWEFEREAFGSSVVQGIRGPLRLKFVNATQTRLPGFQLQVAGHSLCHGSIGPGESWSWRPQFAQRSDVSVGVKSDVCDSWCSSVKTQSLGVTLQWRTHGELIIRHLPDGGFELEDHLSHEVW